MGKKLGKILLLTAAVGSAATAAYYYFRKKNAITLDDFDEEYEDFDDKLESETNAARRSYVSLDPKTNTNSDIEADMDVRANADSDVETDLSSETVIDTVISSSEETNNVASYSQTIENDFSLLSETLPEASFTLETAGEKIEEQVEEFFNEETDEEHGS